MHLGTFIHYIEFVFLSKTLSKHIQYTDFVFCYIFEQIFSYFHTGKILLQATAGIAKTFPYTVNPFYANVPFL